MLRAAQCGLMKPKLWARYDRRVPRYTSYPTAPHFHPGVGAETHARWLDEVPAEAPLLLYRHIAFCDSLCWFCGCHTNIVSRYAPVASYLGLLQREIDLVAKRLGTPCFGAPNRGAAPPPLRPRLDACRSKCFGRQAAPYGTCRQGVGQVP
ncbi:MAG: hypothetical protein V3R55_03035 [Alphaproteobacteria bacterium]